MVDIPRLVLNSGLQFLRSPAGAVDWRQVAKNAANVGDAKRWPNAEKQRLLPTYEEFVSATIPQIIELTGLHGPSDREIRVFDRYDWIKTNVNAFADQFAPLEQALMTHKGDSLLSRGSTSRIKSSQRSVLAFCLATLQKRSWVSTIQAFSGARSLVDRSILWNRISK